MAHPRFVSVATTGGGGGAASIAGLTGQRLAAVALDYGAVAAGTTVTVSFPDVPGFAPLVVPAGNTDRVIYPRVPVHDMSAAAISGRGEERPIVWGSATVTVASAGGAFSPAVSARLFFE